MKSRDSSDLLTRPLKPPETASRTSAASTCRAWPRGEEASSDAARACSGLHAGQPGDGSRSSCLLAGASGGRGWLGRAAGRGTAVCWRIRLRGGGTALWGRGIVAVLVSGTARGARNSGPVAGGVGSSMLDTRGVAVGCWVGGPDTEVPARMPAGCASPAGRQVASAGAAANSRLAARCSAAASSSGGRLSLRIESAICEMAG